MTLAPRIDRLNPLGKYGLFQQVAVGFPECDAPRFSTRMLRSGDMGNQSAYLIRHANSGPRTVSGVGVGLTDREADLPALGEAIERYSAAICEPEQFTVASASELGTDCLDLDIIPRCSQREYADPRCPLVAPDKNRAIRWVLGVNLWDGRLTFLPAVFVYTMAGIISPAERITLPITTGCAAHRSLIRAVLLAILEVIERDAISLVWLQRRQLARINLTLDSDILRPYLQRYLDASRDLHYFFFNATTEFGVPIIYGLQRSIHEPTCYTTVACSADTVPERAVSKVIRDLTTIRRSFKRSRPIPECIRDFTKLHEGATFMARSSQSTAFDFLTASEIIVPLSDLPSFPDADDSTILSTLLSTLKQLGIHVYTAETSTDEALRLGFRVVRVIMPELQPLGFCYRARYLGHPRLYRQPSLDWAFAEEDLNTWPQPFA